MLAPRARYDVARPPDVAAETQPQLQFDGLERDRVGRNIDLAKCR